MEWVLLLKLKVGEFAISSIILFGAPGSGKGTQASLLQREYGMLHISTGNLFGYAISNNTSLGLQVKECMAKGQLVSDDIVINMLEEELKKLDSKNFILDGFPRTNEQAVALTPLLKKYDLKIDHVLFLDASDSVVMERITGRRICSSCKVSWHIEYAKPEKEGICDLCQSLLEQRKDDVAEVVKDRLAIYYKSANSLREFYKKEGTLEVVNAEQDSLQVFKDIKIILKKRDKKVAINIDENQAKC